MMRKLVVAVLTAIVFVASAAKELSAAKQRELAFGDRPYLLWQRGEQDWSSIAGQSVVDLDKAWPEPAQAVTGLRLDLAGESTRGLVMPGEAQAVTSLRLDLARNEKESVSLLISATRDIDLKINTDGQAIFQNAALFSRSRDVNRLIPLEGSLRIKKGSTEELWIRFSSYGAAAGQYEGSLNFTPADGPARKLPLSIKVWKTEMPEENIVHCLGYAGAIGFLNGLTGDPAKDELFKQRLDDYFANMKETRIDVLEIYVPLTIWNQAKIGGRPMQDVLKNDPSILKREPLPEIDLSYYDSFFEIPKKHGLRHNVVMVGAIYEGMLSWLGEVLGEEMTLETPQGRKYAVWLAGAWQKYLKKQGFKNIWGKIDDEIPPERIPSYNKNCDIFRLAGARPYTTWTGTIPQTPDLIRKVNRNAEQWQIQFLSLDIFRNLVNEQPSLIDPTDEILTYAGGGGPYRFSYLHVRLYGFLSGYYNLEGFGWWTYCWWHKNEMIAFRKDGTVYSTPALEGLRDAIEDAQLYVMLNRKTAGGDDKRSWTPTKFSYGLVGRQSGLVQLEVKNYAGLWNYYGIGVTSLDAVLKGKARLLEMLEE